MISGGEVLDFKTLGFSHLKECMEIIVKNLSVGIGA